MYVKVSVFLLQSLHSGVSLALSIEYLIALTCRSCSWAAHKRLSASRLISPRFSHYYLFPSSLISLSLKNWPWRASSCHSVRLCFLLSCLFWTFLNFLSFRSVVAAMISFSLLLSLLKLLPLLLITFPYLSLLFIIIDIAIIWLFKDWVFVLYFPSEKHNLTFDWHNLGLHDFDIYGFVLLSWCRDKI